MTRNKPELLVPANNLEVLRIAVNFGADAIYLGGEAFGLRAKAKNFTREEMAEGIRFAHEHGVKIYITANILAHNADLKEAASYFRELNELKPDGILIADPGLFMVARENAPDIDLHISTQANNVNYGTFLFWHQLGATRVVCGRELSLAEIKEIRANIPEGLEIEAFVHGAMCISYSGRCLLSNYFTGRDANHGECSHACRWKYSLVEEKRPGQYFPVYENERGTYILNSKDLCMVEHLPDLIEAGVDSLKMEGRMKNALYVATVARTYRLAIDDYFKDPALYASRIDWYMEQIRSCTYREFTTGFFYGKPNEEDQVYDNNTYEKGCIYLGIADVDDSCEKGWFHMEQRNKFSVGDQVQIMKPDGRNVDTEVLAITDEEGNAMDAAPHPQQKVRVKLGQMPDAMDILRKPEI